MNNNKILIRNGRHQRPIITFGNTSEYFGALNDEYKTIEAAHAAMVECSKEDINNIYDVSIKNTEGEIVRHCITGYYKAGELID